MEAIENLIEPLLERAENYSKTSIELLKLISLDKTAEAASTLISRSLLVIVISLFAITLDIAVGFWLGDWLGKNYYGFLIVASLNGIIGIILYFLHPLIKARVKNSIIKQLFN
jgi:hypothetical protein